ncbi:hypothetical protein PVL29_010430 [Vitis rotundifolia]|uniref:Uncharacterized protein n=1 Tax=Vitis rotundifolia TaxID=103349 RepID=A0AA39DS41_VITRO|nr:hypothetical protein PVL29_010430 [Vitis rotundifolia]
MVVTLTFYSPNLTSFSCDACQNAYWFAYAGDDENSSSPNQDATHPVLLDLQMAHRLFKRPLTKKQFDNLKDDLQPSLQIRLKQLLESKQACEDMLLNSSNHQGEEARRAIMWFQEGVRLITDGQHLLESVLPDVFTATD